MNLPVLQTIRFAYNFTLGEIGTIIGLIWIPTLLIAVLGFVSGSYNGALADSLDNGLPPTGAAVTMPLVIAFVSLFLQAMIGVAITRQALGLRQGPAFAHFSLGSAELRAVGGFVSLYILLLLFAVGLLIFVVVVTAVAAALIKSVPAMATIVGLVVGLAAVSGVMALVYVGVRLSFLLVPSVVEGNEFGLTRSWELTRGNFWRIMAVAAATLLPVMFLFGLVEVAIVGPEFFKNALTPGNQTNANLHRMAQQMRAMQTQMPLLMGLSFVISPLLYGLAFAPAAFAYRALTGSTQAGDSGH